MTPEQIEAESNMKYTHPRVTLDDIKEAIAETHYQLGHKAAGMEYMKAHPLNTMTLCFIVMKNGFSVLGKSAPASPENFDAEYGKKLAYDDAFKQLWPLMGFCLKQKLYENR